MLTPIVLQIVENAQTQSDERSLEAYEKVLQLTYNGSGVICEIKGVKVQAYNADYGMSIRK